MDLQSSPELEIFLGTEPLEAFKLADPQQKIEVLKASFFPDLEWLVKDSLNLVRDIYGVEPDETMTDVYKPSNRKESTVKTVSDVVYVGISGHRRNSKKDSSLSYTNRDGKSIYIHSAYLTIDVCASGYAVVSFFPFRQSVEKHFSLQICRLMRENLDILSEIFEEVGIIHSSSFSNSSTDFKSLFQDKNFNPGNSREIHQIELHSYAHELPLNYQDAWDLKVVFAAFYPLLDTFIRIGNGEEPRLSEMLKRFSDYCDRDDQIRVKSDSSDANAELDIIAEDDIEQSESELDLEEKGSFELEATLPTILDDARQRIEASVVPRPGQSIFRQALLDAYDYQCVITDCDAEAALEAAHITPYFGEKSNHLSNGLLLRGDIHTLFDRHLLSINPDTYSIEISLELSKTCYQQFHDKLIRFPKEKAFKPARNALQQHYIQFLSQQ
jgi:hypothetical protein